MSIAARRMVRGVKKGGGVVPGGVAGLTLWLKADAITGVSNGAALASWPDSSGAGNPASNAAPAEQPVYVTNVTKGLPIVRFDGTADGLYSTASSSDPNQTIIAVLRPNTTAGVLSLRSGTGGTGGLQARLDSGAPRLMQQNIAAIATSTQVVDTANFQVLTYTFSAGSSYGFWENLTSGGSGSTAATLAAGQQTAIGRHGTQAMEYFNGDIAELACWNRVLSSTEITQVVTGLMSKWIGVPPADTTPPAAPVITSSTSTSDTTPTIAGTAEANSVITLTANGSTYTGTTNSSGSWSVTITNALTVGNTYTISVTARDAANNTSPAATQSLTISATTGTMYWQDAPQSAVGTVVTARNADGTIPTGGSGLQNWQVTPWNVYGPSGGSYVNVISDSTKGKAIQFTGSANTYGMPLSQFGGYQHQRAEQVPTFEASAGQTIWIGFDVWVNAGLGTVQSGSWNGLFQFMSNASQSGPNVYIDCNVAATGYPNSIAIGAAQGPAGTPHFVQDLGATPQSAWTRIVIGMYVTDSETTSWVEAWRDGVQKLARKSWRSFDEAGNVAGGLFYPGSTSAYMKFGIYRGVNSWPEEYRLANLKMATTRDLVM